MSRLPERAHSGNEVASYPYARRGLPRWTSLWLAERQPALHAVSDVPELVHDIGHLIGKRGDRFALRSLGLSNNL